MSERHVWVGAGLGLLVFLVVTTPGWQEVLGISGELSLGQYAPAFLVLGFMAALVAFVLMGGGGGED